MEILPFIIVVYKLVDTMEEILIQMKKQFSEIILETNLRLMDFVKYKIYNSNAYHNFTKFKMYVIKI